jgi:flagellar motility protein MotE (MotC chaperone)
MSLFDVLGNSTSGEIGGAVASAAVGGGGFWLLVKKLIYRNAADNSAISAQEAQNDIFKQLHEELTRLGRINKELAEQVNALQLENINLRREIGSLHESISAISVRKTDKTDTGDERREVIQ